METIALDPKAWDTAVELERRLDTVPGLIESRSHIIVAAHRKPL